MAMGKKLSRNLIPCRVVTITEAYKTRKKQTFQSQKLYNMSTVEELSDACDSFFSLML